ncbi:hypothetical protein MRX96_019086 [Rhipicephalus microplus]
MDFHYGGRGARLRHPPPRGTEPRAGALLPPGATAEAPRLSRACRPTRAPFVLSGLARRVESSLFGNLSDVIFEKCRHMSLAFLLLAIAAVNSLRERSGIFARRFLGDDGGPGGDFCLYGALLQSLFLYTPSSSRSALLAWIRYRNSPGSILRAVVELSGRPFSGCVYVLQMCREMLVLITVGSRILQR